MPKKLDIKPDLEIVLSAAMGCVSFYIPPVVGYMVLIKWGNKTTLFNMTSGDWTVYHPIKEDDELHLDCNPGGSALIIE